MTDKEKTPTVVAPVDDAELASTAQRFKDAEGRMSLGETFAAYKMALFWSVLVSMVRPPLAV